MTRFIPKQFAGNSNNSGVFGSFQEQGGNVGDGTLSTDPATIQSGAAWPNGWSAATNSFLNIPRGEEMEGVERVLSAAVVQQFKDGITFWQPEMPVTQYQTIVQYQTGSDKPKLYVNITGISTAAAPDTDTTNWFMFLDTVTSYEIPIVEVSETSGTVNLQTNTMYRMTISGTTTFVLPAEPRAGVYNQIKILANITVAQADLINYGTNGNYFNRTAPDTSAVGSYDIYLDFDPNLSSWVAGVLPKGATT